MFVKDVGLEHGNSVQTPATHDVTEEKPEALDQVQHSKCWSQVARCLFFSQDRADIIFIVNELCQRTSNPTQQRFAKLKRLVRYLKRERLWGNIQLWENGRRNDNISDSDWADCKEARQSSIAGVILLSNHTLKAYMRKQMIIARSSAEAVLYAAALEASESKGHASLLKDLGYEVKPVLAIDAKATERNLHRQGIGRLKHIDVAYLRMQDEVRSKRLLVRRVKSEENVAGLQQ